MLESSRRKYCLGFLVNEGNMNLDVIKLPGSLVIKPALTLKKGNVLYAFFSTFLNAKLKKKETTLLMITDFFRLVGQGR